MDNSATVAWKPVDKSQAKFPDSLPPRDPTNEKSVQIVMDIIFGNKNCPASQDENTKQIQLSEEEIEMAMMYGISPQQLITMLMIMRGEKQIDENSWEKVRLKFELFGDALPQTVENFRSLCLGANGLSYLENTFSQLLNIKNSQFIVGGSQVGKSIYGDSFPDEQVWHQFSEPGLIAMANNGPDQNKSAFIINFQPVPPAQNLHKQFTVFGRVIDGFDKFAESMNRFGLIQTSNGPAPKWPVTIVACKELLKSEKIDLNGNSLGWNDYVKNGHKFEGITSPEREFDKAWMQLTTDKMLCYQEQVTEEMLATLPAVPKNHQFHTNRQKWLASKLPTQAEYDKNQGSDAEEY